MRKLLLFLTAAMACTYAFAYDCKVDGICYNLKDSTAVVTSDNVKYSFHGDGVVVIPPSITYNGKIYRVTAIGREAFEKCKSLKSITFPSTLDTIESSAFEDCDALQKVFIPKGVKYIDGNVFQSCANLQSIVVEEGNAFYDSRENCNAIVETESNTIIVGCNNSVILNSITVIGLYAFADCDGIVSLKLHEGVTLLRAGAFYCCKNLRSVRLPNTLTEIGWYAFSGCEALTAITIPASVSKLDNSAFGCCDNLVSIVVEKGNKRYDSRKNCNAIIETETATLIYGCSNTTIPNDIKVIGDGAFDRCKHLKTIKLPKGLTKIGMNSFSWCDELQSIEIPSSVTTIDACAFTGCNGFSSIFIPKSVRMIATSAFCDCSGLRSIVVDKRNKFYDSRNNCNALIQTETNALIKGCVNTVMPEDVEIICNEAFRQCKGLTSVYIPASVVFIGTLDYAEEWSIEYFESFMEESAFAYCPDIQSIVVDKNNLYYHSGNGSNVIVSRRSNALLAGCMNSTIPGTVERITTTAFNCCVGLKSITIPASVKGVAESAFCHCKNLTKVTFNGSPDYGIGRDIFSGSGLRELHFKGTEVPRMGDHLFGYDDDEETITEGVTIFVPLISYQAYLKALGEYGFPIRGVK